MFISIGNDCLPWGIGNGFTEELFPLELRGVSSCLRLNPVSTKWPGHWHRLEMCGMPFTEAACQPRCEVKPSSTQAFLFSSRHVRGLSQEFLLGSEIKLLTCGWKTIMQLCIVAQQERNSMS